MAKRISEGPNQTNSKYEGSIWYVCLNNSFLFFLKYVWVKKCMKIRVMLFKNWKRMFEMVYQIGPIYLSFPNLNPSVASLPNPPHIHHHPWPWTPTAWSHKKGARDTTKVWEALMMLSVTHVGNLTKIPTCEKQNK